MKFSPIGFTSNNLTENLNPFFNFTLRYTANSDRESSYTASDISYDWFGGTYGGGSSVWRYSANNNQPGSFPYNLAGRSSIRVGRTICGSTLRAGGFGSISFYSVTLKCNSVTIYSFTGPSLGSINLCPTSITTNLNIGTFVFKPGDDVELIWYDNVN